MSSPVRRIRLPQEPSAWDKKLKLGKWVDSADWDTQPRFAVIEKARESWRAVGLADLADDPDSIIRGAYVYFVEDKEFVDYVLIERDQDMTADGLWEAVTTAYTWVVLRRYNRELGGEVDG